MYIENPTSKELRDSETREADLSPKQREMASKSELIVDNVKIGMGGSRKEIHGSVTIEDKRYFVRFEEVKEEDPNIEPKYYASMLGERDVKGDEYWKQLEGSAAKKFFEFYQPIAKPRIDFEGSSKVIQSRVEDKSIEDKFFGEE